MWEDAVRLYNMVPSIEKGGLANEYLEAQIRMAAILIKYQENYTKARKILESLKKHYSDPAIDAYLGRTYFQGVVTNPGFEALVYAMVKIVNKYVVICSQLEIAS